VSPFKCGARSVPATADLRGQCRRDQLISDTALVTDPTEALSLALTGVGIAYVVNLLARPYLRDGSLNTPPKTGGVSDRISEKTIFSRAPRYAPCWRGQRDPERGSRDRWQCERDGRLSRVARSRDAWLLRRDDERHGRDVRMLCDDVRQPF
jgi:hypothetical protein